VAVLGVVGVAGGAEGEETGDLLLPVVGDEVDMDAVLDRAGFSKAALTKNHDHRTLRIGLRSDIRRPSARGHQGA
jgi:hypothetical protein